MITSTFDTSKYVHLITQSSFDDSLCAESLENPKHSGGTVLDTLKSRLREASEWALVVFHADLDDPSQFQHYPATPYIFIRSTTN